MSGKRIRIRSALQGNVHGMVDQMNHARLPKGRNQQGYEPRPGGPLSGSSVCNRVMMIVDWLDVMRGRPQRVAGGNKERKKTTKLPVSNFLLKLVENVTGSHHRRHVIRRSLEGKISSTSQHLGLVLMEI